MAHLNLAGVSEDGRRLLLADESGAEHILDITAGLGAALRDGTSLTEPEAAPPRSAPRADAARPRPMETQMDSALRPRDIQARIRAGDTPEAVAQAAGTSVDKIMTYAGPVLAEREHVAERAQRSSVRRAAGASPEHGHATLGEAVTAHLQTRNVDPGVVAWDAWRREDGRWTLTGRFSVGDRRGTALLTYDARGSYVILDNDDAEWLVGDLPDETAPDRDGHGDELQTRRRRLSAVREEPLPLGDDAVALVSSTPLEAFLDDTPASDDARLRDEAAVAAAAEADHHGHHADHPDHTADHTAEMPAAEPPPRRSVHKRRGRASVPSWDEIMFGGSDQ